MKRLSIISAIILLAACSGLADTNLPAASSAVHPFMPTNRGTSIGPLVMTTNPIYFGSIDTQQFTSAFSSGGLIWGGHTYPGSPPNNHYIQMVSGGYSYDSRMIVLETDASQDESGASVWQTTNQIPYISDFGYGFVDVACPLDGSTVGGQQLDDRYATLAKQNLLFTQEFTGTWYIAGGGEYTNDLGWLTTGTIYSNTVLLDDEEYLRSPLTSNGLAQSIIIYMVTNSSFAGYYSTDLTNWTLSGNYTMSGGTGTLSQISATNCWVKIQCNEAPAIPGVTNYAAIDTAYIYDYEDTDNVLSTQDFSGTYVLVDDAVRDRSPITKRIYDDEVEDLWYGITNWSVYPATNPIQVGPRWTWEYSGEIAYLRYADNDVMEFWGGGTVTPLVVSFSYDADTTQSEMYVRGCTGFQPFPEFTTNMSDWTRMATNNFDSSYPNLTNGNFWLSWTETNASPVWYRAIAVAEAGITNDLPRIVFRYPVDFGGQILSNAQIQLESLPITNTWTNALQDLKSTDGVNLYWTM